MAEPNPFNNISSLKKPVVELAIQLGVLFVFLSWCFDIIRPFVLLVIWAGIVAIALYPVFTCLSRMLGNRNGFAASLLVLILITILLLPAVMLTDSLLTGAHALADAGEAGELQIPRPPDSVAELPLIGNSAYDLWARAANNLPEVLQEFTPQIKALGTWVLETVTGTGLGVLQFIVSFIIAGVLLAHAKKCAVAMEALLTRLVPTRGKEFSALSTSTVRNVALGIVGVSILQTTLLSIGFLAIDLPGSGLAALAVLILCIIQVGPGLITLPAILYAFTVLDTTPAIIFTIWTLVMTLIDSLLKPLVFGRGATVPTLVIFLGAIGGMLAYGIIGLFVGAIVLSLGFKLYLAWLEDMPEPQNEQTGQEKADPAA